MKKKPTFVKLNRTEETEYILKHHPNAYLLLSLIAIRARRTPNFLKDLDLCEAMIGDYKSCGLSHQQSRTALKYLEDNNLIHICPTNKGTVVKLINSDVFDINIIDANKQSTNQDTPKQHADNKPPNTKSTTNKNDKNIKKERIKEEINKQPSLLNYLKQKITDYGYTETEGKIIEFFNYRQAMPKAKRYKTEKGINGLLRHISGCRDSGLNVFECLEITMEEGWQAPKPEYFKNKNVKSDNGFGQIIDACDDFVNNHQTREEKNAFTR